MALVTDFHTHVLPGIDDGARDVGTSLDMVRAIGAQGVQCLVATPHFYATRDRIDRFLNRRQLAWEALQRQLPSCLPRIVLGAEVAFFRGISKAKEIEALEIEGTNAMLLEMPFRRWSEEDVNEVASLIKRRGFDIVLAHIERYMMMQENRNLVERILEMPVKVQINAEGLLDWRQRGKLAKMVKAGRVHLLGSDCHDMGRRPPNLGAGREVLLRKAGQDCLDAIDVFSERLLLG